MTRAVHDVSTTPPVVVISTTTSTGKYSAQFWTETQRLAGREVRYCWAEILRDSDTSLRVDGFCPDGLLEAVWAAYLIVRAGGEVAPTHTVQWGQGAATFTPIAGVS